jgi:hypothetical protein
MADETNAGGNAEEKARRAAAVATAAETSPQDLDPATAADATAWFLSDEVEENASATLPVNVAAAGAPERWVNFKISVVDRDRIRDLRRESTITKPDGTEQIDEMEANLKIAVEGLLDPDIKGDPRMRQVRGQTFVDPGDALRARFAHKPGLIDQIAGRVVQISGYGENDVREVQAAGN